MLQICVAADGLGMYLVLMEATYWGSEAWERGPLFARGRAVFVVVAVATGGGYDRQGGEGDVTAGRL